MVQIKWLKVAQNDLREVYSYICEDPERYAERRITRILERTEILRRQIRSGKRVEELNREDIHELVEGRYRIIYRIVDEQSAHILKIHHSARDFMKRF